jgi:hypothetical protein
MHNLVGWTGALGEASPSKPKSRWYSGGPANYGRNGCRTPGKIPNVIYHTKKGPARARPGKREIKEARPTTYKRPILLFVDELYYGES